MKYLKTYENFSMDNTTKIIKAGTVLYHGSGEDFELPLRPGGYDGVFWTSDDVTIAKMYIPESGATILTNLDYMAEPRTRDNMESDILVALGIIYRDIEGSGSNVSHKNPLVYQDFYDEYYKKGDELQKLYNKKKQCQIDFDAIEKEYSDYYKELYSNKKEKDAKYYELKDKMEATLKEWSEVEDEYIAKQKALPKPIEYKREYIKKALKDKFGYEPDYNDSYRIKQNDGKILKADERLKGRLFKLTLKRDMKFYDFAQGRESDLTELDYHNIPLFRKCEKEGYDGIIITDFAQSKSLGNVGHNSWGFFKAALPDLDVEIIEDAMHPSAQEVEDAWYPKK